MSEKPSKKAVRLKRIQQATRFIRQPGELFVVLLLVAAAYVFTNPFPELALIFYETDHSESPVPQTLPEAGQISWCLSGDFNNWDTENHHLNDKGQTGDAAAADGIYSLEYTLAKPDYYAWQVIACGQPDISFPAEQSWVISTMPDQTIAFSFNTNHAEDGLAPAQFAANADDGITDFTVVGGFQDWDINNEATRMQPLEDGYYRLVYPVPESGKHTGYVMATGSWNGFGASGRSVDPAGIRFQTTRDNEFVIFQFDSQSGRIAIHFGLHPILASLAFARGFLPLGIGLILLAIIIGYSTLLKRIFYNPRWRSGAGCPQCGHGYMVRIHRQRRDRLLAWGLLLLPLHRFLCQQCHWQGLRLDDEVIYR